MSFIELIIHLTRTTNNETNYQLILLFHKAIEAFNDDETVQNVQLTSFVPKNKCIQCKCVL